MNEYLKYAVDTYLFLIKVIAIFICIPISFKSLIAIFTTPYPFLSFALFAFFGSLGWVLWDNLLPPHLDV